MSTAPAVIETTTTTTTTTTVDAESKKRLRESDSASPSERLRNILRSPGDESHDDVKTMVQELLEKNGSLDETDEEGYALMHIAVMSRDAIVVEQLLLAGANPNVVVESVGLDDFDDDIGCVPLHFANDVNITALLLDHGAKIHSISATGETPFDRCIEYVHDHDGIDVIRFFAAHDDAVAIVGDDSRERGRGGVTSLCRLVMKTVEYEKRARWATAHGDEMYCRNIAVGLRSILSDVAQHATTENVLRAVSSYADNIELYDQKVEVYADIAKLLR